LSTFYDVDRVEVLRGPQGTLYGRNATGGVLNVITTDPGRDFGGYFDATTGNYGLLRVEGAVQAPLSDTLSARIAFQAEERDGYGYNFTAGQDVDDASRRGIRAKLKFAPTATFDLIFSADYYRE